MSHPQNFIPVVLCNQGLRLCRNWFSAIGAGFAKRRFARLAAALAFGFALCWSIGAFAASSGTGVAWGSNDHGQTNVPPDLTNVVAIAGGYAHGLALKSDGKVIGWGDNNYGQTNVPASLNNVRAIAAGYANNLALKTDGTIVAWGMNNFGQNNLPAGLTNVVSIAAGAVFGMALKADGKVVVWGDNRFGQCNVPPGLSNVALMVAGYYHCMALRTDGTVVAWGHSTPATVPPGLNNVVGLAGGGWHSLAVKSDGTVVAWGADGFGQNEVPAGLNNVVALAAGAYHSLALKRDGTIVGWGLNSYSQARTPAGLSNVIQIAAGWYESLAIAASASSVSGSGSGTTTKIISLSGNLAFGDVVAGQSITRTLNISNSGNAVLTISGVTYPAGFSGNWSGSIASGSSQNVSVTFNPTTANLYSGVITVSSDASSGVNTINASGNGIAALAAAISLTGNLGFGDVLLGQSATRTFTVSNSGNALLTVSGISYPAAFSGNWSGGTIAGGGSVTVQAAFRPAAAASYSGMVNVASDAASGLNTLAISGRGIATNGPALCVTPAALDFGAIPAGTTAERTYFLTNTSTSTLNGYATVSSPFMFLSSASYSLAPGQGASVLVRYSSTMPATNTGNIVFSTGGAANLPLRGVTLSSLAKPFVTSLVNVPGMSNGFNGWAGMKLTVGPNPLIVSALGRWCYPGNGRTHLLKLVQADTGADVPNGSASLTMAAAPVGMLLYAGLSAPVTLPANTSYYLVSQENTDVFFNAATTISTRPEARCDGAVSAVNNGPWTFSGGPTNRCPGPLDLKYVVSTNLAPAPPLLSASLEVPSAPQIRSLVLLETGPVRLLASGVAGQEYRVLVSSNLLEWAEITTVIAQPDGFIEFEDTLDPDNAVQFYQLESMP